MSTSNFINLAQAPLRTLENYQPGKSIGELQRELGISNIIKLASNENPLGPSPKAIAAIHSAAGQVHRYSDNNCHSLKQTIAKLLHITPDQLSLGCGSNVILDLLIRAFCNASSEVIYTEHAFNAIPIATRAIGARAVIIPEKNFRHDVDATVDAITAKTRVIYFANPNNPTGTWNTQAEIEYVLNNTPDDVLVIIDQAYVDYIDEPNYPKGLDLLKRYPNLVLTRTFSKLFALADLRIGYAIAHSDITEILHRLRMPFNNSDLSMAAAIASINDADFINHSIETNNQGRVQLSAAFDTLGLDYIRETLGNFFTVKFTSDTRDIYQKMLAAGIIIRPLEPYNMSEYLRITVSSAIKNSRMLEALSKII